MRRKRKIKGATGRSSFVWKIILLDGATASICETAENSLCYQAVSFAKLNEAIIWFTLLTAPVSASSSSSSSSFEYAVYFSKTR